MFMKEQVDQYIIGCLRNQEWPKGLTLVKVPKIIDIDTNNNLNAALGECKPPDNQVWELVVLNNL